LGPDRSSRAVLVQKKGGRAAARGSGATQLVTEDLNHGQDYGGVRAINPFR
jgi:hypothetical protein